MGVYLLPHFLFPTVKGSSMEEVLYDKHLEVGRLIGRARTCGTKVRIQSEEEARDTVLRHNKWKNRYHDVEYYPCAFCGCWHVGRILVLHIKEVDQW